MVFHCAVSSRLRQSLEEMAPTLLLCKVDQMFLLLKSNLHSAATLDTHLTLQAPTIHLYIGHSNILSPL